MQLREYKELLERTDAPRISAQILRDFLETELYRSFRDFLDMRILILRESYDRAESMDEVARVQGAVEELMFLKALFPTWMEDLENGNE